MGKTNVCLWFITLNTVGHVLPVPLPKKAGRNIFDSFSPIILSYYCCFPISMELGFVNWCYYSWAPVLFVKYICNLYSIFSLCIYNKSSIYKLGLPQQIVNVSLHWNYDILPILMRRVLIKINCYLRIFCLKGWFKTHRVFLTESVLGSAFVRLIVTRSL